MPQAITLVYRNGDQSGGILLEGNSYHLATWGQFKSIGSKEEKFPGGNSFMNIHEIWGLLVRKKHLLISD